MGSKHDHEDEVAMDLKYLSIGMTTGAALGISLGLVMDSPAIGLAIGMGTGVAIGMGGTAARSEG